MTPNTCPECGATGTYVEANYVEPLGFPAVRNLFACPNGHFWREYVRLHRIAGEDVQPGQRVRCIVNDGYGRREYEATVLDVRDNGALPPIVVVKIGNGIRHAVPWEIVPVEKASVS